MTSAQPQPFVTVSEAAARLGVSVKTVYSWRAKGWIHPAAYPQERFKRVRGGNVLYDLTELRRVRDGERNTPASEAEAGSDPAGCVE